jgi:hypothetical protein
VTKSILTQDLIKSKYDYDEQTGIFTHKKAYGGVEKGQVAGCLSSLGYTRIKVNSIGYMAHRLAWIYVFGNYPTCGIDHINRIKTDNRIANLRELPQCLNMLNNAAKGFTKRGNKYRAQLGINGKKVPIGTFNTEEAAKIAYLSKKFELYPQLRTSYKEPDAVASNF